MSDITTAFWGMTINNYDETDLALVRQGYPDYVRKITFTLERGDKGTPHIQAWLRLYRQQRLSYVKKLFPRGNFKALTSDEYKLNAEAYATKQDETAESPSVIINNPFPDPVVELTSVVEEVYKHFITVPYYKTHEKDFMGFSRMVERRRVAEKPTLAKFYVSATYKSVKKDFWMSIAEFVHRRDEAAKNVVDTHTHTHADEKFSVAEGIDNGEDDVSGCSGGQDEEDETEGEDYEDGDCSEDEGHSESGSSCSGSSDDSSEQ